MPQIKFCLYQNGQAEILKTKICYACKLKHSKQSLKYLKNPQKKKTAILWSPVSVAGISFPGIRACNARITFKPNKVHLPPRPENSQTLQQKQTSDLGLQ